MSIVFFGSDQFSLRVWKSFWEHIHSPTNFKFITAVTSKDGQFGNFLRTEKSTTIKGWDQFKTEHNNEYDLGVVASFGKFIPTRVISRFKTGILNVHPSLLPKYRGAAPIQRAIIDGHELGVSIIDLHPKIIDGGHIYVQEPFRSAALYEAMDYSKACTLLGDLGGKLLANVVNDPLNFPKLPQDENNNNLTTYASKVTHQDALINLTTMTGKEIMTLYNAIGHQETLFIQGPKYSRDILLQQILLQTATINSNSSITDDNNNNMRGSCPFQLEIGQVYYDGTVVYVGCSHQTSIAIIKASLRGKSHILTGGGLMSALHLKNLDYIL